MSGPAEAHRWGRFETAVEAPVYDALDPLRDVRATADFTSPSGARHCPPRLLGRGVHLALPLRPGRAGAVGVLPARRRAPGGPGHRGRDPDRRQRGLPVRPLQRRQPPLPLRPPADVRDRRRLVHAGTDRTAPHARAARRAVLLAGGHGVERAPAGHARGVGRTTCGSAGRRGSAPRSSSPPTGAPPRRGARGAWPTPGASAWSGCDPEFFRRLDARLDELAEAGIAGGAGAAVGHRGRGGGRGATRATSSPRRTAPSWRGYQVARWQAHPVAFILNGDGRYTGEHAARWQRIGRAVFGATDPRARPPVAVHPGGAAVGGGGVRPRALAGHPGLPERPRRG